jgi:transposase-like protein
MTAPVLAVGDGALGFWKALRDMFPDTCEQCWWHKMANVLAALPKPAHAGAKAALYNAEDLEHARKAATAFENDYGKKFPKAVAKITDDLDVLLEFYNYPAEHWIHPWSEPAPHSATRTQRAPPRAHRRRRLPRYPKGMSFGGQHGSQRDRRVRAQSGLSPSRPCGS